MKTLAIFLLALLLSACEAQIRVESKPANLKIVGAEPGAPSCCVTCAAVTHCGASVEMSCGSCRVKP